MKTIYLLAWKWFNILIAGVALSAEGKPWVHVSQRAGNLMSWGSLTSQGQRNGEHRD